MAHALTAGADVKDNHAFVSWLAKKCGATSTSEATRDQISKVIDLLNDPERTVRALGAFASEAPQEGPPYGELMFS